MNRILLYGATGYTGRLIAQEAALRVENGWRGNFTLASRDDRQLRKLAAHLHLPSLTLALDSRLTVVHALEGFDVVINAAGPFTRTASRLAKAALDRGCHYVDLNGEVDVYQALDDLAPIAAYRGLAMVCGAGWMCTASDVLLDHALEQLKPLPTEPRLATLRIALSRSPLVSRGSAATMARAVREEVNVIRGGKVSHVSIGRLERSFDFGSEASPRQRVSRIASAVNVLDTLALNRTAKRHGLADADVESYMAMSDEARLGYQLGAFGAVAMYLPFVQRLVSLQLSALPEGPSSDERHEQRATVVLTIDDAWSRTVANWVLETPDLYDFSAVSALEVALRLSKLEPLQNGHLSGWLTPSAVLAKSKNPLARRPFVAPFEDSVLYNALTGARCV